VKERKPWAAEIMKDSLLLLLAAWWDCALQWELIKIKAAVCNSTILRGEN